MSNISEVLQTFLHTNYMWPLLSLLTSLFVLYDRAFPKVVRIRFYHALFLTVLLAVTCNIADFTNISPGTADMINMYLSITVRPLIVLFLSETIVIYKKHTNGLFYIPYMFNLLFILTGIIFGYVDFIPQSSPFKPAFLSLVPGAVFVFYFAVFIIFVVKDALANDKNGYTVAIVTTLMLIYTIVAEYTFKGYEAMNSFLCLFASVLYFYMVTRTYKRDALTKLYIRHNLNFELSDLHNTEYFVVLIDIDNFKLINDKYGHDKGDEALVTVVKTIKANLIKGCRMYRFGGDEFVIISRNSTRASLIDMLEKANHILLASEFHFSYGIALHKAGEKGEDVIKVADKEMYENKRFLKTESIWDDMTGLYNYKGFLDEIDSFRRALARDNHTTGLIAIDIERLGNINTAYGYSEGNMVISALARVLKACLRGRDFIGHLGSDEFVVAVELEDKNDKYMEEFIQLVIEGMDNAYEFVSRDYTVDMNFSKYVIDENSKLSSEEHMNVVLYNKQEEKDNRRKTEIDEDDLDDYDSTEEETVLGLIDNNQFRYAYQPIVSAKTGDVVAYEGLMRTKLESNISPLKILKYAAKNKRTYDIEKLTISNILNDFNTIKDFGSERQIFINSIPGYRLNDEDFGVIKDKYSHLFPRLVMEITEIREISEQNLVAMNQRRSSEGLHIAIDDYGSGCSNTNSLLRYNPDIVKLDRLLITGIDKNSKKQFFVKSIITFAKENNILILAEGVETESEMRTVIRLGVDLIQGYYTSKPSFEIVQSIDENVKKAIVTENTKILTSVGKKVYTASSNTDLAMVHLAMEEYTRLNISTDCVKCIGNTDYSSDICIAVKDGTTCELTIEDIRINSIDDQPCIIIGDDCDVTLRIEGNNILNAKGIYVPESSTLTLKGSGTLSINVKGHDCYCIGTGSEESFGHIILRNSGILNLNADGEFCVGIGGGVVGKNSHIEIRSGVNSIDIAGVDGVAIGAFKGDVPIEISECALAINLRINQGIGIGTIDGKQNISMNNFDANLSGSGRHIGAVGSYKETSGRISMEYGSFKATFNGHYIHIIGAPAGHIFVHMFHIHLDMLGEGDRVLALGSIDMTSEMDFIEVSSDITINSAEPVVFGSIEPPAYYQRKLLINGKELRETVEDA